VTIKKEREEAESKKSVRSRLPLSRNAVEVRTSEVVSLDFSKGGGKKETPEERESYSW